MARYLPEPPTPPAGEEIHLPEPSIIPIFTAVSIMLIIVGLPISWGVSIVGGVLFLIFAGIWIRDTRHELDELPPSHH
jgi:hypothetical protein